MVRSQPHHAAHRVASALTTPRLATLICPALRFYSIGWASFITLTPKGHAAQYNGLYYFVQALFQPIGPAIYTAVVQPTNLHRVGWATLVPWCIAGAIAVLCVDFNKGKREAGRVEQDIGPAKVEANKVEAM